MGSKKRPEGSFNSFYIQMLYKKQVKSQLLPQNSACGTFQLTEFANFTVNDTKAAGRDLLFN